MNEPLNLGDHNLARTAHNFLMQQKGGQGSVEDLNLLNTYVNYILTKKNLDFDKKKVGVMFVCINPQYWQYAEPVITGIKNLFLPGHDTEIMCWSDIENYLSPEKIPDPKDLAQVKALDEKMRKDCTIFTVDSVGWPYPTLMRYHLFLAQEEYLKKFDYLFYIDLDMRIVNVVGEEILGDGLTMAQHPMYAIRSELWNPYEPNPESAAYIKTPGRLIEHGGKKVFQPLYAAGGVQGGTTETFLPAMKAMKKSIDDDFNRNYIARWNDESHWNRYLFDHPPAVVLDPSYVYPDSLIEEYYIKVWGRNYNPRIITITKPFSLTSAGGQAVAETMKTL